MAIGLLFGSLMVLPFAELPPFILSLSILLLASLFLVYFKKQQRSYVSFILVGIVGFFMTALVADYHQKNSFQAAFEGKDLIVRGQIAGLVKQGQFSRSFLFNVTSTALINDAKSIDWQGLIRLSVYHQALEINAGERWQFQVRLKRGAGFKNPSGFDYEKWLFSQRIEATGYLRPSKQHKQLSAAPWYSIDSLRETIHNKIKNSPLPDANQALLSALILAEKSDISTAQWTVFKATGTSHLMAISGLHIGLVASSGLLLVWLLWWCFPKLNLYLPHRVAGSALGVILAVGYAMLAGMTIPTQRALLMVVLGLFILAGKQYFLGYRILAAAMIVVLISDPLAVMGAGFYLSFSAVLVIIWLIKRVTKSGKWGLLSLQVFLSLLMIPLSLLFFGEGSLISPVANLIAIPWVSLVIVPLSMLSVLLSFISEGLAAYLFQFLSLHFDGLSALLACLAKAPGATLESFHLPAIFVAALVVSGAILLMPVGLVWRYAAGITLLPLVLYQAEKPINNGDFWLTVLDVGQGLAVVIETKQHSVVYDTGNRSGSFDLGEKVVVPYLKHQSLHSLDALIISHDDRDHMGGLEAVLASVAVKAFYGNRLALSASRENILCEGGDHWEWDGVQFEFIHPADHWQGSDNDRSCVLKVSTPEHAILLTGDIQTKAEKHLLRLSGGSAPTDSLLRADILLMAHHGSNSSSTARFIAAVNPTWAIASAGYRSRFKHPDPRVVSRYHQQGVTVLNTATSGAIQFKIQAGQPINIPKQYRRLDNKFWSRQDTLIQ